MVKKLKFVLLLFLVACLAGFITFDIGWNIDPNYSVKFAGTRAEGTFSGLAGTVQFDKNDLPHAKMDVTVAVNTIKTGNSTKDKHAKGDSWLDAEKYPQIKFTSSLFVKKAEQYIVTGTLELHGVKKEIQIPFSFSEQGNKASFTGSFKVNRKDYGINGNMMGFLVGDDFDVTLNVPVTKK